MDDGFVGLGVTELFPREPGNGGGIVAQGVNVGAKLLGDGFLLFQLGIEVEDFAAHALILMNQRQIREADEDQNCHGNERHYHLRQPAPDAKINFFFHWPE